MARGVNGFSYQKRSLTSLAETTKLHCTFSATNPFFGNKLPERIRSAISLGIIKSLRKTQDIY